MNLTNARRTKQLLMFLQFSWPLLLGITFLLVQPSIKALTIFTMFFLFSRSMLIFLAEFFEGKYEVFL